MIDRRTARRTLALVALVAMLAAPSPWGAMLTGLGIVLAGGRLALVGARRLRELALARAVRRRPDTSARIGRDARGRPVGLSDEQLAAHALVVGASGAGKSTTLLRVLEDRIARGDPVVAVDMKGSPSFAGALRRAASAAGRELRIWTPEGPSHWNPLAHGSPTALKDKLISAERFSEPHYRRAAERYLQSALQVLGAVHRGRAPTLSEVVAAMEPGRLRVLASTVPGPLGERVVDYLGGLTSDQLSAARGLGTRLALLAESDAGPWLEPAPSPRTGPGGADRTIDLGRALTGGELVLVSINSSVYGALGAQLGALAVQDLTSAAGRRLGSAAEALTPVGGERAAPPARPATIAIDEFSALGADNVLNLLARGREAGVSVLLATQELSDLERAGRGFRDQVLGITAVTLAHRQEVHASAEAIARIAGTRMVWRETQRLGGRRPGPSPGSGDRGTRRQQEEPVVHPDRIKRLPTGQLVLLSHVPHPIATQVRVDDARPESPPSRGRGRGRGIRSARRGRDQPPPGVTR